MSETKFLKDIAVKIPKKEDIVLKLKQLQELLEKRSFDERLKMGEDAIKAYGGR